MAFQEYTQGYFVDPSAGQDIYEAPSGVGPVNQENPVMYPYGLVPVQPGTQAMTSGPQVGASDNGQFQQRYDESVVVARPSLVPGLRGSARTLPHYGDPMIEPSLGPILEMNGGYPLFWGRSVVKSYKPSAEFLSVTVNGGTVQKPRRFQAQAIQEINARSCT